MQPTKEKSDTFGRYVVNRYITDSSIIKGNNIATTTYTVDTFDPADILYTFTGDKKIAVEVKVRNGEYTDYIYEVSKDKRLQEYREQGYTIIYANLIEDNQRLFMWNVTDLSKVRGVQTKVAPYFVSTYDNPKLAPKMVYTLPVTSAFVNVDATQYINDYKTLSNAYNQ